MNDLLSSKWKSVFLWLFLVSSACFLRMPGLGTLGLWGDEGFTAIAVASILEHGYPLLPSGGIYPRALLFSYLEALSAKIFGLNEFALRFPNTIFGLAGIWMTYILGKCLYGKRVGCVAAVFMTFSIWEITFSRYARMYVFFQFFYLLSIYLFYRGFVEGERSYRWFTALIWMFTITIHQIGVSLAALLIVPFFIRGYQHVKKWQLILGIFGLGLFWKLNNAFQSFLRNNIELTTATGKKVAQNAPIALPPLHLWLKGEQSETLVLSIFFGIVILSVSFFIFKGFSQIDQRPQYCSLFLITLTCVFHQIALALVLLVVYSLLFFNQVHSWRDRPFLLACAVTFLSVFWWTGYGSYQGFTPGKIMSSLFQYPYLYERFLKFFIPGWPFVMVLTGLGLFFSWYHFISDRRKHMLLMGIASLIGPLLFVSLLSREDDAARYSFHLYPVMLILGAYGLVQILARLIPQKRLNLSIVSALLFLSLLPSDFQLSYALGVHMIDHKKKIAQTMKATGYNFYPDYKTPSQYIRDKRSDDDLVISMLEAIPVYYAGQIDYLWIPKENDDSPIPRYGFTGKLPRIRFSQLEKLLRENRGKPVWLLEDPIPTAKLNKNFRILEFLETVSRCQVIAGVDGKTFAYHFFPDEAGRPVCISS